MAKYIIKPNFNRIRQQVGFPAKNLNFFMRDRLADNFGFYQSRFGCYSWLQLNKLLKYVIHSIAGNPLLWQVHKSCGWDDTGSLRVGRREMTPTNAKINESFCYDELFDGCFEHFLSWNGRGPLVLDANGIDMINKVVQTLNENATLGARVSLTIGQRHDLSSIEFSPKTTPAIQDLFSKTAGTVKGWVELFREMGEKPEYQHLNQPGIFAETDFAGEKYIGDVLALYDNLREAAPADLQALINEGGIRGSIQGSFIPLFKCSMSIFNAVVQAWRDENASALIMKRRIERREFDYNGTVIHVYFIDDTPIIPVSDINCYDKYLTGTTHFAGIIVSGNIGMGGSFGEIPNLETPGVGMMIQRKTDLDELGKYLFLAHALFTATLADHDYAVASQVYAVAA